MRCRILSSSTRPSGPRWSRNGTRTDHPGRRLIHIVGPQGSGKTILAEHLRQGLKHAGKYADIIEADDHAGRSNNTIRAGYAPFATVIVIASERQPRHAELAAHDTLITLERGAA